MAGQQQIGLDLTTDASPAGNAQAIDPPMPAVAQPAVVPAGPTQPVDAAPTQPADAATPAAAIPAATQAALVPAAPEPPPFPPAPLRPPTPQAGGSTLADPGDAAKWLDATCPYLRSADGTWRSVIPQRGQRCWGQTPPAPLEPAIQERLCRTEAHTRCEIYLAAEKLHLDALARDHVAPERLDGRFGVLVRPATLVLDQPGHAAVQLPVQIPTARRTRVAAGLAIAGGVVLVALVALAGLGGGTAPTPTQPAIAFASSAPVIPTVPPATAPPVTPQPLPTESAVPPTQVPPTPVVTPPPTRAPNPTPTPRIRTTYLVKQGDTLDGIATKFGVTKKQILAVNDFGNPPHLRYGFKINIPYP